ncbi:hypothetical protein PF008_g32108 [Phytophthora fragariae]|uniref:Uncharacterized protein n=1 Tax=Phytophthora fragariae TaxID=53985 RepID=A0A6G0Q0R8_9STRA|nr:hypothetical protein PF008_g32108 [Phytophthora fragariae]
MGSHLWILPCVCGFAYSVCGVHLLSLARRSHPDWWWWPTAATVCNVTVMYMY